MQSLERRKIKRERGSEFKFLFRVSSSSNERPLNSESLIMFVLIIKRELPGPKKTAEIRLHCREEERKLSVYVLYLYDP